MNNVYGITKPSLVNPRNDVDIFWSYRPNRNSMGSEFDTFHKLTSDEVSSMFRNAVTNNNLESLSGDDRLPGMYNLQLPVDKFGKIGYYTLYIKPKEFQCRILAVGSLFSYPDVKGIVVDINSVEDKVAFENGALVGYRIEYVDNNGKRGEMFRLVTSNSKCEAVTQTLTTSSSQSTGYRYTESGSLSFITVTPSTSPSFQSGQTPFIGNASQNIILTNTKFDPIMLEVQIVEHDDETISTMLEGNQIRSLDKGLVTTYNKDGELYLQQSYYSVKDNYTTNDVYEVRKNEKGNISFIPEYNNLIDDKK